MLYASAVWLPCAPPAEVSLYGYDHRLMPDQPTGNAGILDPTGVQVCLWHDDQRAIVTAVVDCCLISVALAASWRTGLADYWQQVQRRKQQETNQTVTLDPDEIIIVATHTHSGPILDDPDALRYVAQVLPHSGYDQVTPAVSAHTEAIKKLYAKRYSKRSNRAQPVVRAWWRQWPCTHGYVRRVMTPDGLDMCWNPHQQDHLQPEMVDHPQTLWVWETAAGSHVGLATLPLHPVSLGQASRFVSADWPGGVRQDLAASSEHGPGMQLAIMMTAAADAHPWIATQNDPAQLNHMSQTISSQMKAMLPARGSALPLQLPKCQTQQFAVPGQLAVTATHWHWPDEPTPSTNDNNLQTPILTAISGELFTQLGRQWHQQQPNGSMLITNAQGWSGYWPDADSFAVGNYEVAAAETWGLVAGDGEKLIEQLLRLSSDTEG